MLPNPGLIDRLNAAPLQAWGILRHDGVQRTPAERAAMIRRQGIRRIALDWRYRHLEQLDIELAALRMQKIAVAALWAPVSLYPANDVHLDLLFDFIARNELRLALWSTLIYPPDFYDWVESKKLALTCEAMERVADRAARLDCTVALYNYEGWFGRPASLARIVATSGRTNMGIVYNFCRGHGDIAGFADNAAAMLPYLSAVNLGGLRRGDAGFVPFGSGEDEQEMLATLLEAGYRGPLGLACHDMNADAGVALAQGLDGLARFRQMMAGTTD
ncbi:sugar phosphate isomerase/epimerase family protein [Sphingopyxis fribergensis]